MRVRCGALGFPGFSKSIGTALCEIAIPGIFAKLPVGAGIVTPSALKEFMLNPSTTSQNAFGKTPPLTLIASSTSSRPNVLLSTQNDINPSGYGLSRFGPGIEELVVEGKTTSIICLKNGNGSPLSPVTLRNTPDSSEFPAATIVSTLKFSWLNKYQRNNTAHPVFGSLALSEKSTLLMKSARALFSQSRAMLDGRAAEPIDMSSWVARKCDSPSPALPSLLARGDHPNPCSSMNISVTSATSRKRTISSDAPFPGISEIGGPDPQLADAPAPGLIWTS